MTGSENLIMDEVEGFAKTDVLMQNLYRGFMVIDKAEGPFDLICCKAVLQSVNATELVDHLQAKRS